MTVQGKQQPMWKMVFKGEKQSLAVRLNARTAAMSADALAEIWALSISLKFLPTPSIQPRMTRLCDLAFKSIEFSAYFLELKARILLRSWIKAG